jgi:hypothetical protein
MRLLVSTFLCDPTSSSTSDTIFFSSPNVEEVTQHCLTECADQEKYTVMKHAGTKPRGDRAVDHTRLEDTRKRQRDTTVRVLAENPGDLADHYQTASRQVSSP